MVSCVFPGEFSLESTQEFNPEEILKVSFSGTPARVILVSAEVWGDLGHPMMFPIALVAGIKE